MAAQLLGFHALFPPAGFGPDKCGSPGAASLDGSAGQLAPAVPQPQGHFAADTASAGSPGDTPTSPLLQQAVAALAVQQQQLQQHHHVGSAPDSARRSSKRKAPAPLEPATVPGALQAQAQAQPLSLGAAPMPPTAPDSAAAGCVMPLDLPLLDDFDDVPGLDDLLMEMGADGDPLFNDPFGPGLDAPWPAAATAADPFAAKPAAASAPVVHEQRQAGGATGDAQLQASQVGVPPMVQQLRALEQRRAAVAGAALPPRPTMAGPFASSAPQQGPGLVLVPQQQAQHQAQLPVLDRAGSAETRRSQSSAELPPPAGRVGSKADPSVAAAPPAGGQPSSVVTSQQRQVLQAAAAAAAPRPAVSGGGVLPGVPLSGAAASSGVPAALQRQRQGQGSVRWMSRDPSSLRPVKRAALSAPPPPRPVFNAAALKLSPAAALVAAAATHPAHDAAAGGNAAAEMRLLRFLFGGSLPAPRQTGL